MPLFGNKHHNTAAGSQNNETPLQNDGYAAAHTGAGRGTGAGVGMHDDTLQHPVPGHATTGAGADPRYNNQAGAGTDPRYNNQTGAGTDPRYNNQAGAGTDPRYNNQAGAGTDPRYNNQTSAGTDPRYNNQAGAGTMQGNTDGHHGAAVGGAGIGSGVRDQYGVNAQPIHDPSVPPNGAVNHPNQTRAGAGQSTTGKIEHALGSLIGSTELKAKGLQKQQEANSAKIQDRDLAEAERLEREAATRRERAVTHGAHPDNRHAGGRARLNPIGGGTFA